MFNRVRVISGLLGVLALFVLLQLVSGSAFFNTVKADKENFAYNQRLATLQQAMGTSWVSLVQARNTLNRAGIRYLLDSQQAGSGATVQDLVALANQELKVADQGFADFNANLSEKGKTAENVLTLQANYKAYRDALTELTGFLAAGNLRALSTSRLRVFRISLKTITTPGRAITSCWRSRALTPITPLTTTPFSWRLAW